MPAAIPWFEQLTLKNPARPFTLIAGMDEDARMTTPSPPPALFADLSSKTIAPIWAARAKKSVQSAIVKQIVGLRHARKGAGMSVASPARPLNQDYLYDPGR